MKLPYGYVLADEELVVHEEKADVVRSIFEYYLAGASSRKVVDHVSSVYLVELPHAFSTGYLASFRVTFSFMIASRSKPQISAIKMQ